MSRPAEPVRHGPRVVVVLNPARRRSGRALAAVRRTSAELGLAEPVVLPTTVAEPGGPQALRALELGADRVLACGGDGTVREAAGVLAGTGVPIGIVPAGTANLFARNLRLPLHRPHAAARTALTGAPHPVDLGRVRLCADDAPVLDRVFLVLVGLGHDAETVARTSPVLKHHIGWAAYFAPGLRRLTRPLLPLTVSYDAGPDEQVAAWSVLVGSCGRIPLGVDVLPGARVDDGLLHLAVVAPRTVLHWLPIAVKGLTHLRSDVPGVRHDRLRALRVQAAQPLTAQLDGDPCPGVRALEVRVDPGALLVAGASRSAP